MKKIVSKAIQKYQRDGILKLVSDGTPYLKNIILDNYYLNKINILLYRQKVLMNRSVIEKPLEPIYVNPQNIEYSLLESNQTTYNRTNHNPIPHTIKMEKAGFKKQEYGTVLSRDWDLYKMRHKDEIIFRGLYNHLVEGQPFCETEYGYIKNLQIKLNMRSPSLNEFYDNKISSLIESLETNGYIPVQELYNDPSKIDNLDEVDINIGRNGELISNSKSHHRLSLAKILDIEKIPVVVIVRHSDWQDIRTEVKQANSFDELNKKAKNNIHHPDLKFLINYEIPE